MERIIQTRFFHFSQNNSGGYFVIDKEHGVCEEMIIEAVSAKDAFARLEVIGEKVNGFNIGCSCCGERWSSWLDDEDGTEEAVIYCSKARASVSVKEATKSTLRNLVCVHYYDGTFEMIELKDSTL